MIAMDSEAVQHDLLKRLSLEVRHALHGIMGSLELISEGPLSAAQWEELSCGRESARELLRMVTDIAELADDDAHPEKAGRFRFPDLLDDLTSLFADRVARKNLAWHWVIDPQVPHTVRGHRHTIERALYRLLNNSLKLTDRGGIELRVKPRHLDHRACQIVIEVTDSGSGAGREFWPAPGTPDEGHTVDSMEMQLARKQLAGIGGEIEVCSHEDKGATVSVVFWVTIVSGPAIPSAHALPGGSPPLNLLIAEDSDDSFFVFQHFVAEAGHTVARAFNGAQAVDMFKTGDYDLVVMDVNMPMMDGYTASRAIREWETQQHTARRPILLLSADEAARQSRLGSMAGCSGFLAKPVCKEELLWALGYYSGETSR